ncbi:hypothetical protein HN018_19545 [Lichenicola cladoniae]|uniref:Uncharacterized protein n=1 Tax=Lichenicola cladoniae TaxID=1484109 RepID=A0A6M8HTU4_9PROT|nr:hypothetical protein [Lichenicola cladoniae]NPD66056.1 hypothetical protein [Acetobacteraceae bacterium]QKE91933.1 hypothetical protein HN018_19545 [Lichenicola cladoniae]
MKNVRTAAREKAMSEVAQKIQDVLGDEAFTGDAHAFLVAIYKDPTRDMELRIDAAKAAVRFEKPALASSTVEVRDPLANMTDDQLLVLQRIAAAATGEDLPRGSK